MTVSLRKNKATIPADTLRKTEEIEVLRAQTRMTAPEATIEVAERDTSRKTDEIEAPRV